MSTSIARTVTTVLADSAKKHATEVKQLDAEPYNRSPYRERRDRPQERSRERHQYEGRRETSESRERRPYNYHNDGSIFKDNKRNYQSYHASRGSSSYRGRGIGQRNREELENMRVEHRQEIEEMKKENREEIEEMKKELSEIKRKLNQDFQNAGAIHTVGPEVVIAEKLTNSEVKIILQYVI